VSWAQDFEQSAACNWVRVWLESGCLDNPGARSLIHFPKLKRIVCFKVSVFPAAAAAGDFCVCVHVCCRDAGGRSMDFLNKIGQQAEGLAGNVWNHCKSVYQEYS
jgi:hypothetical protein